MKRLLFPLLCISLALGRVPVGGRLTGCVTCPSSSVVFSSQALSARAVPFKKRAILESPRDPLNFVSLGARLPQTWVPDGLPNLFHQGFERPQESNQRERFTTRFWDYWGVLRVEAHIPSHRKAVSLAGGGSVSSILYATNADEIVIVDQSPWDGPPIPETFLAGMRASIPEDGFQTGTYIRSYGIKNSLVVDLEALGVDAGSVRFGQKGGAYTCTFNWAYPGQAAVERTLYAYPGVQIQSLTPGTLPPLVRGAQILLQKAADSLAAHYDQYLETVVSALAPDAYLLTDDATSSRAAPFPELGGLEDIHTRERPLAALATARQTVLSYLATYRYNMPAHRYGYGWDLQVRRRIPKASTTTQKSPRSIRAILSAS